MTDDLLRYGTLGGAYVGSPEGIAELFENTDIALLNDGPWEISYLGGKERWPTALDYISNDINLFRQWAYRRADGHRALLQEIDRYVDDVYQWLKQGKKNGRLDDIELERLKRVKEALTEKLSEYVPERLIAGGLASIEQLLRDIENTEHVARYPAMASPKWYNAEIVRLCLLAEKIKLLMRLVEKVHPETADKCNYLYYLDQIVGRIASFTGVLERSRDELRDKVGTGQVNVQEHLSEIDEDIDKARKSIDDHFNELRERLASSKPLARMGSDEAEHVGGTKTEHTHIDLRKWNDTGSRKLLYDLLSDRSCAGVDVNTKRHGKNQPKELRQRLKERGLAHVAEAVIRVKDKRGTYKLDIARGQIGFTPPAT